ncbi:Transcription antiterminator LicT [Jeotgalibaca dankookensis]|uniref:Transcription antiterminator LicT n=1 Tax=Jeotgalibaca dankookensis TaxID=708126 RepID=A0A1S6IMK1_9LACT|nr:PRD domain-containing protein [Jeotgalibaca dankookensis]AQS52775.1 Transcription antiterminator LicT [Jeotgalibaca dankookensis]
MKVIKVINNNIVKSFDHENNEVLVMGKGIGFQKKPGNSVNPELIEKVYVSSKDLNSNRLAQLLSEIPIEHIQLANEIISFAKASLGKKLNDNIFLTLTDHVSYAIERYNNKIPIKNALLWEIKRFYNHEYLIGKEALSMIKSKLGIDLPEDEAGFIALHIVNAELDMAQVSQVTEMTKIIQDITNIVRLHFQVDLDEYSLNYERFIVHLKFFVQRLFTGVDLLEENDSSFLFLIKEKYREEYLCALKIRKYIMNHFDRDLQEDEIIYLTIHIKRITN